MTLQNQQVLTGFNNSGFSLINVLVGIALVAVVSAGMAAMMTNSMKAASYSEARFDQSEMLRQVQLTLSDKPSCEASFKDVVLGAKGVEVSKILDRNGVAILKLNELAGNRSLLVRNIKIQNKNIPPTGGLGDAELVIQTEKVKSVIGSKESTSKLVVKVNVDPSGKITECFSNVDDVLQTALQLSCSQVGGVFDVAANQCKFNSDCSKISDDQPVTGKCVKLLLANTTTEITQAATEAATEAATTAAATVIASNTTTVASAPVSNTSTSNTTVNNTTTSSSTIVNKGVNNVAIVSGISGGSVNVSSGSGNTQSNSLTIIKGSP